MKKILLIAILFFSNSCLYLRAEEEEVPIYQRRLSELEKVSVLTGPESESVLQPQRIIEAIDIKQGMNILDIGAGAGLFTFRFADALGKTGKVFATDVDPRMVEYIKKRKEESNYKNIFPLLVKREGLDPFYRKHSFDIIFLCRVYQALPSPVEYLRELRPSLKGSGSLYIIHPKNVPDFAEFEFDDFKKVVQVLSSKGEGFPVFQRLPGDVKDFIRHRQGDDVPPEVRKSIIRSFNEMLCDKLLLNDLLDYYNPGPKSSAGDKWARFFEDILHPSGYRLANWLIVQLYENGALDEKDTILNDIDEKRLRALNRILLTGIFQSTRLLFSRGPFVIYVEKNRILSELSKAGFRFVREYDFLPQHYFLEFKREY
jgi:ubiquinone/menaquinone biosynthesis C-methylase UbiE